MLKGILFDLDGTLVNSLHLTFNGFNEVFQTYGQPPKTPQEILRLFGPGEVKIFEKCVGAENAERALAQFVNYTRSRVSEAPLFEGALDALIECEKQGLKVGIVTGRGRESADLILSHHGIRHRFPIVVTHDDVSSSKPSPEGIHLALKHLNLSPEHSVYVGDMWMDVRAAKRAGCRSISATWDHAYDHEAVKLESPDRFCNSWNELFPL